MFKWNWNEDGYFCCFNSILFTIYDLENNVVCSTMNRDFFQCIKKHPASQFRPGIAGSYQLPPQPLLQEQRGLQRRGTLETMPASYLLPFYVFSFSCITGTTRDTTNSPNTQHILPKIFPKTVCGTTSPYLKRKCGNIVIAWIWLGVVETWK